MKKSSFSICVYPVHLWFKSSYILRNIGKRGQRLCFGSGAASRHDSDGFMVLGMHITTVAVRYVIGKWGEKPDGYATALFGWSGLEISTQGEVEVDAVLQSLVAQTNGAGTGVVSPPLGF